MIDRRALLKQSGALVAALGTATVFDPLDAFADTVTLPWSYDKTTTLPAVFVNISAQGDSNSIGCRIKVDDVVKDERTANTVNAYTYCLDKSG